MKEDDLYAALNSEQIAGAALDVFNTEPPAENNPLFELDNVKFSPPIQRFYRRIHPSGWELPLLWVLMMY